MKLFWHYAGLYLVVWLACLTPILALVIGHEFAQSAWWVLISPGLVVGWLYPQRKK